MVFNYEHGVHIPGTDFIVLSNSNGNLLKYDVVQQEAVGTTFSGMFSPRIRIGDAGNGMELFVFRPSWNDLFIYDPDDLTKTEEVDFNNDIWDLDVSENGFLYMCFYNFNNSFSTVRRNDWEIIGNSNEQSYFQRRLVRLLNKDNGQVVEVSNNKLTLHQIEDDGTIVSSTTEELNSTEPPNDNLAISPNGQYFMPYASSRLFDSSLNLVADFPINANNHLFSADNQHVYIGLSGGIRKYSIQTQQVVETFSLPSTEFFPLQMFHYEDRVMVLSHYDPFNAPQHVVISFID